MLSTTYMRFRRKLCHLRGNGHGVARWSNLMATRKIIPLLRSRFDPNSPPCVNIGLTTDCNYKCPFCPHSSYTRESTYITISAFQHVIQELKRVDFVPAIILSNNSEAFLHPQLLTFCQMISDELPKTKVYLISNGSLITKNGASGFSV